MTQSAEPGSAAPLSQCAAQTAAMADLPHNSTFDPHDRAILARFWYPVALVREVGQEPVAAMLLDEALVVYHAGDEIVVARDICPHRGVPLSLGTGNGESIACAYHGFRFGQAGRCVKIPAHPDGAIPKKMTLRTYPSLERYGLIWVCLAPAEGQWPADRKAILAAADIPAMPHWDEAGYQQIVCPTIDIHGFAGRQMEGFLDVAHFAFVHTDTFADPENPVVPPYMPVLTEKGFEVGYRSMVGNYPIGVQDRGRPGFEWLRHFRTHLPFTATLEIHFPDDGRLVIMNAASPVSARVTRLFAPICRNFDTDQSVQAVYDFNRRVFEEDKAIVESQKPECLPLDPSLEAHVPADRSSIAYRRGLRGLGLSRFFIA